MRITASKRYINQINHTLEYISKDSPTAALNFFKELNLKIENIISNPYMYRKSIHFNNDSIRDLIFSGYVVPYKITTNQIVLLGIVKSNLWK